MSAFRFEQTRWLSEREYVAIRPVFSRAPLERWARRVALYVVGVTLLFSPYTLLLGAALLILGTLAMVMPRFFPATAARTYAQMRYLHGPVTYGVDATKFWVAGRGLRAEAEWPNLAVWDERGGYLMLSANGMAPVFLRLEDLKSAGVYDAVVALAKAHAAQFDQPAAIARKAV